MLERQKPECTRAQARKGRGQTKQEAEAEPSSLQTCLQGNTQPEGTLGWGGGMQHGTCRESGPSQKNPGCSFSSQGVLGDACLQSWFSLGPESLRPPRAWAPVGTAGEAGAEHLPIGRTPGSCPVLSLPLPAALWQGGGPQSPFWWCGGGSSLGDRAPQQVPRPRLGEGVQGDHKRQHPAQLTMAPKSWF